MTQLRAAVAGVASSLGCGVPTAVADLREGETVLDLGSGAGADVLISARRVGPTGRAIGLDMTDEMLSLAQANAKEAGVDNAEFLKGYLEEIPLPDGTVDVVISNCVINLAADKTRVLREAARVLRPGGRVAVSDVVADPDMDDATRADMEQWTGCVAGALTRTESEAALTAAGLVDLEIQETHRVHEHASQARRLMQGPTSTETITVRAAERGDADAIAALYNQGIAERQATFETRPREPGEINAWFDPSLPFLVAEDDAHQVVGFARVSPYSDRCVYQGVGEHGVYVDAAARGQGVGRRLLDELAREAERQGLYKLTSRVFTTNAASLAAHRAAGFEEIGVQRRHGKLDGEWKDCVLVERLLGEAADS